MTPFKARLYNFRQLLSNGCEYLPQPLLLDTDGGITIWNVSPHSHGRSFIVGQTKNGRSIISKGNGLAYTSQNFMNTGEMGNDTWGLLLRNDATRDFTLGNEIASLGIKTNRMEYVLELECEAILTEGKRLHPCLLQYDVECPYRISDSRVMNREILLREVYKWEQYNDKQYDRQHFHLIAANVLLNNLRILHDNKILHNAITSQNYTWALELLDFELACSPKHPYDNDDYVRHVPELFPREMIHTYNIIIEIAETLGEQADCHTIDQLFEDYGFDMHKYKVEIF